ncbi:MAG: hypothetical protein M3Z08_01010 [Chloroflexota bacterium]|nr:hypothetical protein [Chloroflexota bacterium]
MDAVKPSSPRAEQLLSEYSLGNVRAEYKEHLLKRGLALVVYFPLGLIILFVGIVVVPNWLFPMYTAGGTWPGLEQLFGLGQLVSRLTILLMGGCSTLLGLACLIILVWVLWQGEQRVYLGEKGFISARRQVETAVRWEAVQEIRRSASFVKLKKNNVQQVTTTNAYMLIPAEGKLCSISAESGPEIEQAVTAYLLPRALENYQAGKTLSFGWLALDNQGLHLTPEQTFGRKLTVLKKLPAVARALPKLQGLCVASGERFLPWENLACYWIDEAGNALVLSKKGERKHWAIVPLEQVANPALCLTLIDTILYGDTRESA